LPALQSLAKFTLACALTLGGVGALAAQDADLGALLSRAVLLQQSGDLEGAAALYVQILRVVPQASRVRSNLGAAWAGLGRYDDAIDQYEQALKAEDDPSIRQNLAVALLKTGRIEDAAAQARQVLAAQPTNRDAVLLLADCEVRLGEDAKAVEALRAAPLPADDKASAYLLGTALLNLNRTAEAQEVMDRLFRDDSPESHVLLGSMHAKRKDWTNARVEYEKARGANPKLPLVNFLYGEALMKERNDWAGAAAAFRAELELNPNHFESNLLLGTLLREEGKNDEALQRLKRAAALRGDDLAVRFSLGATQLALGRLDEAERLLTDVAAAAPGHLPTQMQLAVLYTRMGRPEEAAKARANAVRLTKDADARSFQGVRESISDLIGKATPEQSPQPSKQP
jgi:tetratricopeptide (TPR) repeat protein